MVDFPTRVQNKSSTATDNIFINTLHFSKFLITPLINGLSDHDVQFLMINEIKFNKINIKCNITNIKFLGIMIDNTLTWKRHN
jgi:hypothetical protein